MSRQNPTHNSNPELCIVEHDSEPCVRKGARLSSSLTNCDLMSEHKQAETCVAYVRVSSLRQAEEGVSIEAQVRRVKAYAEYRNYVLPDEHIFIDERMNFPPSISFLAIKNLVW